jgi:hypothetical protein
MTPFPHATTRRPRIQLPAFFNIPTRARATSLAVAVVCALAATSATQALDRSAYSMEILVNGRALDEIPARGTTYIEAIEGAEYTIRLSNRSGERVAIALSVDGLSSIDATTTDARSARKWILGPWETIDIDGWQTSSSTARKFYFTSERESYGAWLGKTKNLGIISAAVFREKPALTNVSPRREQRSRGDASGAPAAPTPYEAKEESAASADTQAAAKSSRLSDDLAATGIGREVDHRVRQVRFDAEERPAAVLDLRYEYHDALARLGVVPRCHDETALSRRERSSGFAEAQYAPDPYRRKR